MNSGPVELFILPDEDAVCQAIYAGTVKLGKPDVFLSRELTDGVMHFLLENDQLDSDEPVNETVVKIVRELGHPRLAQVLDSAAMEQPWVGYSTKGLESPAKLARDGVFPPNLIAAHDAGLLHLGDMHFADRLVECVLPGPREAIAPRDWPNRLAGMRRLCGRNVIIDTAETYLGSADAAAWLGEFVKSLRAVGLAARIDINERTRPGESAGTLFKAKQPSLWGEEAINPARELLQAARKTQLHDTPIRWRWHLCQHDFAPENADELAWLAESAMTMRNLELTFDREPVTCQPKNGMLLRVEASLTGLQRYLPTISSTDELLAKIGSLVRLALSAGHAKRRFLRQHGPVELRSGFVIDRAALQIDVTGVADTLDHFCADQDSRQALRQQLVQQVGIAMSADGHSQPGQVAFDDLSNVSLAASTPRSSLPELVASIRSDHVCVSVESGNEVAANLAGLLELLWLGTHVECLTLAS